MLQLQKPLAVLDLETTGTNFDTDQIIQIGIIFIKVDGSELHYQTLINPGMPIPPEATAIHHITDEMVAEAPMFLQVAYSLREYLRGHDIGGFSVGMFDLPMLTTHFKRCGIFDFPEEGMSVLDGALIFQKLFPRTLEAAYKYFCGKVMENAHNAFYDAWATKEVLLAQTKLLHEQHQVPLDIKSMERWSIPENWAERTGKIRVNPQGQFVLNFGKKHFGKLLTEIAFTDPDYIAWILENDFSDEVKSLVRQAFTNPGVPTT